MKELLEEDGRWRWGLSEPPKMIGHVGPKETVHVDEHIRRLAMTNNKPEDKGIKYDDDKLRHDLLPNKAIAEVIKVLMFGANKYGDHNWEKGIHYHRLYNSSKRHLDAWWDGEENDNESGLNHLAHAACCVLFLLAYRIIWPERKEFDDRI